MMPLHLCLWSQHNPELADNLNEGHLCLQQSKPHSNAVSWTIPKRHVSTRMTLGLFLRSEPKIYVEILCLKCFTIVVHV